ncbi:FAD-dependent oxidoreductase [Thalassomonas sp. RHCl1]|uniref:FAD-dependent oxidoreductase n=1 Tax=Thalassomonas sp. RHCl1 TaxID=2995320 RepID=UPI00248B619A|nr:FAD-dependent oxidoreductase [Thalassomonas sp. RHCl1]
MEQNSQYDLIIIGGGAVGLSCAYHGTKRGLKTLVIEKNNYFNDQGSSAGHSRQFRLQYAQDYMAELCIASQSFWRELDQLTQETLLGDDGSLWFGDPKLNSQEGGIDAAKATMDALGIPYTPLTAAQIEQQYQFKNLPPDYEGFFQAGGGTINLKATEQVMYDQALNSGLADFHELEEVTNIDSAANGVITVTTDKGAYQTAKLAITTGPYVNHTVESLSLEVPIIIWPMSSAYFEKTQHDIQYPSWFVFQEPVESAQFYGFPEVDWSNPGYIRVATDFPDDGIILTDPDDRPSEPSEQSLQLDSQWVREHMTGLSDAPYFTDTCLIALAQDSNKQLLLDYMPEHIANNKSIVTYTAGWAAKFIPILGDMICQMLETDTDSFTYGQYTISRDNFSINWLIKE